MFKQFADEQDEAILAKLVPIEAGALNIATIMAAAILILWVFPGLDHFAPLSWSKMTANSAVGMLLTVVGVAATTKRLSRRRLWIARAAATFVLALGALTMLEYTGGFSFGIDRWLPYDPGIAFPGRPSPQTSLGYILAAVCILSVNQTKAGWPLLADISVLLLVALVLVMFGGHFYGALDLLGLKAGPLMSPQTLVCFACVVIVLVFRRARQGNLLAVLVNVGIGSRIVRVILPAAFVVPYLLFALEAYAIEIKALSVPYARAIAAALAAFLTMSVVTWMGWRINALERNLRDLSLRDELTGLYNRRGFYFLGQQAIRNDVRAKSGLSMFFFDLNDLKHVNDMQGHEAGSVMIKAFAMILLKTFRESDIVGRVGGDEFAVLTIGDGGDVAKEILPRLERNTVIFNYTTGQRFPLSFSMGYTQMSLEGAESLEDLITRADALMYADKAKRKSISRPMLTVA